MLMCQDLYLGHLKTMQSLTAADNCVDSEIAGFHLMQYNQINVVLMVAITAEVDCCHTYTTV